MTKNKNTIQIIITSGLILVLIFIIYRNLSGAKKEKVVTSQKTVQPQVNVASVSRRDEEIERVGQLQWRRDPFALGSSRIERDTLILNGIVWDEKSPSAIINGSVLKIGDEVNGNIVVDIEKDKVILSRDNNTYELNLQRAGRE